MKLIDKKCLDINKKSPPLSNDKIGEFTKQLDSRWRIIANKKLKRSFKFNSFTDGVKFVNKVARLAERENHHPDIYLYYKKVEIALSTHAISGLSENDFILAAKIDRL